MWLAAFMLSIVAHNTALKKREREVLRAEGADVHAFYVGFQSNLVSLYSSGRCVFFCIAHTLSSGEFNPGGTNLVIGSELHTEGNFHGL